MAKLPDAMVLVSANWNIKHDAEMGFRQNASFYYLTGLANQIGAVLLLDGPRTESTLFVADDHPGVQFFNATVRRTDSTAQSLGVTRVLNMDEFVSFVDRRLSGLRDIRVLVASEPSLVSGVPGLRDFTGPGTGLRNALSDQWPNLQLAPLQPALYELRAVKSSAEIDLMREASRAAVEALTAGLRAVAPGKQQREVEVDIMAACLRAGADGVSWWPWAQTGPNAVFPKTFASFADYQHLNRVMQDGELARLDVGCEYGHYQSDVGRTVPVSGRWTAPQRETWNLLIAGYTAGLGVLRDGTHVDSVRSAFDEAIRRRQPELQTELAIAAAAILLDHNQSPFWQLHGVGLESAEPVAPVLRAGMVVAFEPMFVVESQGFYLEDLLLVTQNGYEVLTPNLPNTAREIEEAMLSR